MHIPELHHLCALHVGTLVVYFYCGAAAPSHTVAFICTSLRGITCVLCMLILELLISIAGSCAIARFSMHIPALHHLCALHVGTLVVDFSCGGAAPQHPSLLYTHPCAALHVCFAC